MPSTSCGLPAPLRLEITGGQLTQGLRPVCVIGNRQFLGALSVSADVESFDAKHGCDAASADQDHLAIALVPNEIEARAWQPRVAWVPIFARHGDCPKLLAQRLR